MKSKTLTTIVLMLVISQLNKYSVCSPILSKILLSQETNKVEEEALIQPEASEALSRPSFAKPFHFKVKGRTRYQHLEIIFFRQAWFHFRKYSGCQLNLGMGHNCDYREALGRISTQLTFISKC